MSVVSDTSLYTECEEDLVELPGVPILPMKLAVVCCVLNFTVPGTGTMVAGVSVFCCGQVTGRKTCRKMFIIFFAGMAIGIIQLVLAITVVGYILSCIWGLHMIDMSKRSYNKNLPLCVHCVCSNTVQPNQPDPRDLRPPHYGERVHRSRGVASWIPGWNVGPSHSSQSHMHHNVHDPNFPRYFGPPTLTLTPRRSLVYQEQGPELESVTSQMELGGIVGDNEGENPNSPPPPYTDPRSPLPSRPNSIPLSPPPPYEP